MERAGEEHGSEQAKSRESTAECRVALLAAGRAGECDVIVAPVRGAPGSHAQAWSLARTRPASGPCFSSTTPAPS
jgi:hypothetical protein